MEIPGSTCSYHTIIGKCDALCLKLCYVLAVLSSASVHNINNLRVHHACLLIYGGRWNET